MSFYTINSKLSNSFENLLRWREKHLEERYFVIILSFIIGLITAILALLLKTMIHSIQHLLFGTFQSDTILYLILPPIGILLTAIFVRYVIRDDISHGVTKVLASLSQRKSRIKPHNTFSSLIASTITIGFGGSVGAESPIVLTGAAIGSNVGRIFHMEQRILMLLVGCGAAGAIAGIFKAPITGLVFVVEVLLLDLTMSSILPLLISSVTSASLVYVMTDARATFSFSLTDPFMMDLVPYIVLLGIVCGLMSLYFSRTMFRLEGRMKRIKSLRYRWSVSVLILSLLVFLFPPLYGEGYNTVETLLGGQYSTLLDNSIFESFGDSYWAVFLFLLLAVLTKVFASVSTNSGGGCGGLFAPTLFVGAITGFLFAYGANYFPFIQEYLPNKNFTLFGMAGLMAGVMHAPLTGVFLIAELTGGYNLFLPLMLVSLSSYATIRVFMPHSIYSLRLAEEGKLLTHSKDTAVLTLMNVNSVIEQDFEPVLPEKTLGDLVKVIASSHRNMYPVVDESNQFQGVVMLDNIRNIMFRPELYDRFKVKKIMVSPPARIKQSMSMESIMTIFDDTKAWNLPVIDDEGRYLGFVSKSKIFNTYREVLTETFVGD
ncbi:chloride channel protein [Porphyromonas macacae]|uniref:chloride channel protein n=1 Tax=Porphyromonas macacae TaxID=28115 RepID=UPI00068B32C7|nr:chloride channel protein [Porphyromonas macacae]